MGDVIIGDGAVLLPHSVLLPGSRVGPGEVWGGVPARPMDPEERAGLRRARSDPGSRPPATPDSGP